ncbi:MAG: glycosyltransferase family 2 protein, partial [Bacteroidota bacterium]
FLSKTEQVFRNDPQIGIVAYRIFNGIQLPKTELLESNVGHAYSCSEFAGCGYAISRKAYEASGGFPKWMNIYGEEAYISLRVFEKGYRLTYEPSILVHHRIDKDARKTEGYRKFRFGMQLRNNLLLFMKLYPYPYNIRSFIKCVFHNLFKYGSTSFSWHLLFWKSIFEALKSSSGDSEIKLSKNTLAFWM